MEDVKPVHFWQFQVEQNKHWGGGPRFPTFEKSQGFFTILSDIQPDTIIAFLQCPAD
jgi:hypothetical protein